MLVFIYFFEKMDLLRDNIERKERNEQLDQADQRTPVSYVRGLFPVFASLCQLWTRFNFMFRVLTLSPP